MIGAIGSLLGAKEGTYSTLRLTKNPALEAFNLSNQSDYSKTHNEAAAGLDQYIKDFLAGNKAAGDRTGQEIGAVNRYYNGDVERQLADLRARSGQASQDALNRSLGYMTANQNRSAIGGAGGDSSYNRQLGIKTGADMSLATTMQNLAQQRADEEYMRQNQLGLAGRRTGMADTLAARDLVPGQQSMALQDWNTGAVGRLLSNDQSNNMYAAKYNKSTMEKLDDVEKEMGSMLGGLTGGSYGGGGGGAAAAPTVQWQPGSMGSPGVAAVNPYGAGSALATAGMMPGYGGSTYQNYVPPMGANSWSGSGWGAPPTSNPFGAPGNNFGW